MLEYAKELERIMLSQSKSMKKYTNKYSNSFRSNFCTKSMIWYTKTLQTFAPVVTCSQNLYQNALKEPKTFDPAVTGAQLQK